MSNRIGRRGVIGGALAVAATGQPALAADRLTVTSYGGIWEGAVRDAFVTPFTAKTGVPADILLGNPDQWINQVAANPAHPPIDVIVATPDLLIAGGNRGLFEKVTLEKLPALADVPAMFVQMCGGWGCAFDYGTFGFAYHSGRVPQPPKSIVEFVERTARGDWQCSLMSLNYQPAAGAMLWSINDVFGGTLDNLTPGLDAIKRMRPNTIFWSGVTDFLNHIASGQADIGIYADGRTWAAHDAGQKDLLFLNPTEKGAISPVGMAKPVNASPLAWEYINLTLSPGPQTVFGERLQYGMSNPKTTYSDKLKSRFVPFSQARVPPFADLAKVLPAWVERWNKEIGA
jgi:putative spermidine/putrescine transport system substrate-binding protein